MEEDFARRFTEIWKNPSPDLIIELAAPDVVLYQPHLPMIRGRKAAFDEFQRLFRWLPGVRGEVERFCGSNGIVFIEWQMIFPIGKKGIAIKAVDRFILKDGLCAERMVYFNQTPLVISIITHPRVWFGFLKYRFGRGGK